MSRWHNIYEDGCAFFCTVTVSEWRPILNPESIKVIYEVWDQCRNTTGVNILGYCLMSNHIHFILWSEQGANVRQFMHTMTALTSKRLQKGGCFWKERPRVFPIYSRKVVYDKT